MLISVVYFLQISLFLWCFAGLWHWLWWP